MLDSEPPTPFIPPRPDMGTPSGNSPAVLPAVIPMSPSQSSSSSHPSANPFYSPYTGTPFIPPPMAPPGSYYMPTIQLPDNAPPHHPPPGHPHGPPQPPGVSAEWIGPPAGQQPAGYATPFGQPMGLSPSWAPAGMATPFAAYGAYAPQLPPTNPPAAPGQYGPPPGPPPGPPGHGYAGPYATPAPQFAIPPGYQMAYATPAWGHTPMAFAAAPGPPPPAAPPRPPERLTRAERFDKVEPFAAGPHYGPVLEPVLVKAVGAILKINPFLLPLGDDDERAHLRWNMLFSTAHCHRSTDPSHRSWSNGRQEPATVPRVTELRLISRVFPWTLNITASNRTHGVTCGDLVEQLSDHLQRRLRKDDYDGASGPRRGAIRDAYHHNRSRSVGVPGGRLGDGLKVLDWLGTQIMFGGIQNNEHLLVERFNVAPACMLELVCVDRPLVGDEDDMEELRQARRRGRHRSTSRPPSRMDGYSSSASRD